MEQLNEQTKNAISEIKNALHNKKGQLGLTIVTCTPLSMLGGKKNPFIDRVEKVTTWKNPRCGVSYTASVEGKMERQGMEEPHYEAGKSTTDFLDELFQISKDGTKCYLKIGVNTATTSTSVVLVDGQPVYMTAKGQVNVYNQEVYDELKPYIKPSSAPSQRQISQGVNADDVMRWVTSNVLNVKMIAQGRVADGTYNVLYETADKIPAELVA